MPFNTQPPYNILAVNNVLATRNFGTLYTNNTGRTMFVHVNVRAITQLATDTASAVIEVDGITQTNIGLFAGAAGIAVAVSATVLARPGSTYRVISSVGGTGNLVKTGWTEAY